MTSVDQPLLRLLDPASRPEPALRRGYKDAVTLRGLAALPADYRQIDR